MFLTPIFYLVSLFVIPNNFNKICESYPNNTPTNMTPEFFYRRWLHNSKTNHKSECKSERVLFKKFFHFTYLLFKNQVPFPHIEKCLGQIYPHSVPTQPEPLAMRALALFSTSLITTALFSFKIFSSFS